MQEFNVQFKSGLNQLSLSHESNKKDEKRKTKQKKTDGQLSLEMVIKNLRGPSEKMRETMVGRTYRKGKF